MKQREIFPIPHEWLTDMDISLSETVSRWARQEVISRRLEFGEDYEKLLLPAMEKLFVDIGLQNLVWPEKLGGCGLDTAGAAMTFTTICEQAGRADTGMGFLLANLFTISAAIGIAPNVNTEMLEKFQELFCDSGKAVFASLILPCLGQEEAEEEPLFNGLNYQVKAKVGKDDIVLNGMGVRPQALGRAADIFGVVTVFKEGAPGFVIVRGDAKGISASEPFLKTGLTPYQNAQIDFKNVKVPMENLAIKGKGAIEGALNYYYLCCAATAMGAGIATWEILKSWGEERVIKGKGQTFKDNPLTAALMGEIGGKICSNRILLYSFARMLSKPENYGPADSKSMTALAHRVLSANIGQTMDLINKAMELMGSAGYATEWNLERYWRDVKTMESYLGPEVVSRQIMAKHFFGSETNLKG